MTVPGDVFAVLGREWHWERGGLVALLSPVHTDRLPSLMPLVKGPGFTSGYRDRVHSSRRAKARKCNTEKLYAEISFRECTE